MKARVHVKVSGNVQGVFFRSTTCRMAIQNGLNGWVRNNPDGTVEAVFEGEREAVAGMVEFCHQGPPGSKVSNVEVSWEDFRDEFRSFGIRQ